MAVLDGEPIAETGHVVDVCQIGRLLLADGLLAQGRRRNEELGNVRPQRFTGESTAEQQVRGNLAAAVPRTLVDRQPRGFLGRLNGEGARSILCERDVTQLGSP